MSWNNRLDKLHQNRRQEKLWRQRSIVSSPQGREIFLDGQRLLNFCSNDYLGLADHRAIKQAATESVAKYGVGSGAAHLINGHMDPHHDLEIEIASWVGAEKAILFSTGYMANLAIPQAFLNKSDLLLQDRLNHASLIDGGRFSSAKMIRYPHCDTESVSRRLKRSGYEAAMVMTDGVFSMDGTVAPVPELNRICKLHEALLVIDEAHSIGLIGPDGAGLIRQAGLCPTGNLIMMGTLGKACGSFGAFVAGDQQMMDHLVQFGRSYIYTTAIPPALASATLAAIRLIREHSELRERLSKHIEQFRSGLESLFKIQSTTAIQPIPMPSPAAAIQFSKCLKQDGILVSAIRPPTVPPNGSRLRITLSAAHRSEDVERLVQSIVQISKTLSLDSIG
ncbi:MAG: 8-amino-7-oxononanoate synthase [Planctomycetota bacterium]